MRMRWVQSPISSLDSPYLTPKPKPPSCSPPGATVPRQLARSLHMLPVKPAARGGPRHKGAVRHRLASVATSRRAFKMSAACTAIRDARRHRRTVAARPGPAHAAPCWAMARQTDPTLPWYKVPTSTTRKLLNNVSIIVRRVKSTMHHATCHECRHHRITEFHQIGILHQLHTRFDSSSVSRVVSSVNSLSDRTATCADIAFIKRSIVRPL